MNINAFRWSCSKHGEHGAYLFFTINGLKKIYCMVCLDELLTRLGVHGMFPVGERAIADELPAPGVESWIPEELDLPKDEG